MIKSRTEYIRSRRCCAFFVPSVLFSAVFAGCHKGPQTTSVAGKVSFNGRVVSSGLINFASKGGRPIGASIDSTGAYVCELPVGEYQVRIDTPPPIPDGYKEGQPLPQLPPRQVPEKYASYNTSGLTASITSDGAQTVDFILP